MKIVAIGIGECGGKITDTFYNLNNYAKSVLNRRIEIVTDAFALNSDKADLEALRHLCKDKYHRIELGGIRTAGHGVGKINITGTEIAKASHSDLVSAVIDSRKYGEADAVVVVASGGGGTGSGAIVWFARELKRRLGDLGNNTESLLPKKECLYFGQALMSHVWLLSILVMIFALSASKEQQTSLLI